MKPISLVILSFLLNTVLLGQEVVKVNAGEKFLIGKNISYFIDSTKNLTAPEALAQPFMAGKDEILNFGNIPHNVWMKFSVQSETESSLYLEIAAPLLSELEVYEMQNEAVKIFTGSFTLPFSQRQVASENWLINLNLVPSETKTFLIKGQSLYPFQIPISVAAKDRFLSESQLHYLFWGLYIGVMVFAFIYNMFIYFSLRERTYLYYLIYIAASSLFYLGLLGFDYQYLWPNVPVLNQYLPLVLVVTNVAITLFATRFLQITKVQKWQFYIGRFLLGAFIMIGVINLTGKYEIAIGLAQLFSLFIAIYFITIGFLSLKRGVPTAKYYLIGWTTFLVLVILFLLTLNNVVTSNFFTTHCLFIGHMTEVLLLSFALADRINWLKAENIRKQAEVISVQQKANAELEQKVQERTAALVANQKQLLASERMATVGVIATRMAHEIQNPLNFVNNFSDLSDELVAEFEGAQSAEEKAESMTMLKQNMKKINEHGKRASDIIKQLQIHIREGKAHDFFDDDLSKLKDN